MNGIVVIALSLMYFVGATVLLVRHQMRIQERSIAGFVAFGLALLFGAGGIGALTISTFDPMTHPATQWFALGAYALCLMLGFGGALLMFRKRQ